MTNRIITISRQFGSGGRTIGKEIAAKLGIPCYDQELVTRLAKESGFTEDFVKTESEYAPTGGILGMALSTSRFDPLSNQDKLWIAQTKIIRQLAEQGPCVIVGRCADYILEGRADLLKVFIHASFDYRAHRITEVYGETEVPTERRLRDKDKRRASYYQFYTDRKWGAVDQYQVALDSGALGIEKCVDIIASLY